jgi:hypothetical protein
MTSVQETNSQSPWITVWFSPRQSIDRVLVSRLRHLVLPLASLGTVSLFAAKFVSSSFFGFGVGYQLLNWRALPILMAGGTVFGIVGVYTTAFILSWLGRYLGGRASPLELRVASAWSALPSIFGLLIILAILAVSRAFDPDSLFAPKGLSISVQLILALFNVWSLVIFLVMISHVHQFTLLWAIITYVLEITLISLIIYFVRTSVLYLLDTPSSVFQFFKDAAR